MADNKRTLTAKTFTPVYDELEDRIRLTINYQDFDQRVDFVITRALIINLIPAVNGYISKYYKDHLFDNEPLTDSIPNIKTQNKKSAKKDNKNSKQLNITDSTDIDLLRTEDIVLYKVDLTYNQNSKNTTMVLSSKEIITKSIMDYSSLNHIINTLKNSIPGLRWGLSKSFIHEY